MNTSIGDGLTV
ncbi:hypothetical protein CGLO_13728 [Colletotrichum gloeosporioides Cg-14]|uniref:Uncharacterized protein n=1 Tax=Colletotrichum gloeosporioides (strain Cg-14) TaxID=1237896 RepID=T0JVX3_COLGC|nr:hypothetical protein CGLO_13728 [Colletotrichum gloeosporioides Cg-14]